jgi:hypothetical protein
MAIHSSYPLILLKILIFMSFKRALTSPRIPLPHQRFMLPQRKVLIQAVVMNGVINVKVSTHPVKKLLLNIKFK